jgi:hypothetical protein
MSYASNPLTIALLVFLACCGETCYREPAHADAWTADEVAVARLTVSESSFANTDDARVITWIVAHQARRRGVSIAAYVATVHHRHTRNERRPWLAGLGPDMSEPAGWPASVSWPERGVPLWTGRLADVRRFIEEDRHGCESGTPVTWAGTMDTPGLRRWEARGYRVLRCGRTRNRMVGR